MFIAVFFCLLSHCPVTAVTATFTQFSARLDHVYDALFHFFRQHAVALDVAWLLPFRTAYAGETGDACSKRIYVIDSTIRIYA